MAFMSLRPCLRRFSSEAIKRFSPMLDRVLVEKAAAETQTKGGIYIPEKAQHKVLEGTILAVGPGARTEDGKTIPVTVKVGDRVLLPEYGGTKFTMEDQDYFIYREGDIIGIWDK